ncbi:MAG: DUF2089 domain-containing protein [candidate division WOR-3 bacterium]
MVARKALVTACPVCSAEMTITRLSCESCGTSVEGRFEIPLLCRLPDELYQFLVVFVKNRGVIRDVEKELGISYPTVRSRLDATLAALGFEEKVGVPDKEEIIERLERGELTPEQAERMLKGEME